LGSSQRPVAFGTLFSCEGTDLSEKEIASIPEMNSAGVKWIRPTHQKTGRFKRSDNRAEATYGTRERKSGTAGADELGGKDRRADLASAAARRA